MRELALWDGSIAVLLDGGDAPAARPPVHLQAASGGYIRLVGPRGPILWGLVDPGWYAVDLLRAPDATLEVLPPLRATDVEADMSGWIRRYARVLAASTSSPVAVGRNYLLASMGSVASVPRQQQHAWPTIEIRPHRLDDLRAQGNDFSITWDVGYLGLVLLRELSDENDGRIKSWRKRARDGTLPPLLVWWCRGLFSHVLLDGHDRLQAALLEGVSPDVVVLADIMASSESELLAQREESIEQVGMLDAVATVRDRASATNAILRAAWDPRREWNLATPGFPLDVEQWKQETRGTMLEEELRRRASR